MISKKQRKNYLIIVSVFMLIGLVLFGSLAIYAQFTYVFAYSLLGGLMMGGTASGSILFGRYIKQQKSAVLIVLCCIFFPIALMVIIIIGMVLLIPYYISNIIVLVQVHKKNNPNGYETMRSGSKRIIYSVFGSILIVSIVGYYAYTTIRNTHIANSIVENTGYTVGSPQYVIYKNYYYDQISKDYNFNADYDYLITNNTLFILVKKGYVCYSNIIFELPNGQYPDKNNYNMSGGSYGELMRRDIDELFSMIKIANVGDKYAYMLIIDARSKDERLADLSETFSIDKEAASKIIYDNTFADPDELRLVDENGSLIERIEINDGRYIAYCDSFRKEETDYCVMALYKGETLMLLTYEDVVSGNITRRLN